MTLPGVINKSDFFSLSLTPLLFLDETIQAVLIGLTSEGKCKLHLICHSEPKTASFFVGKAV